MQLLNYLDAKIIKIDEDFVYLDIGSDENIKWPKNKISDLNIFEGKKIKMILGGEEILEEQKQLLYKKIINEMINDK
jgi:hypothetical protein